ncbi:MAG TPA: hypothetical protein VN673_13170 [Clostridia bacterium]|nr:hypothetical protein [Clostridia bacterium]
MQSATDASPARSKIGAKLAAWARHLCGHRWFPLGLALGAVVLMLPAVPSGLMGDDLIQRLTQFKPAELPARIFDTGFVPSDSGSLGTVLGNLFGYLRGNEAATRARDYGFVPWWAPAGIQAALWRPLTAFTHWIDYRLFPNTPALMHLHSIAWYAAAVFLAATLYRKIGTSPGTGGSKGETAEPADGLPSQSAVWAAGLAAGLFLLDKNTYFPVMYVANRGFIISLVCGLLCLQAHHRWRTTKSPARMWLSAGCLLLALLANEGGASTLAFLLAYALVLEPGGWRPRLGSLLPAAAVVLGWRAIYVGSGFGVRNLLLYIDPGYSPLLFVHNLASRANELMGGQLTGVPPELGLALNPQWQMLLAGFFAAFSLVCAVVFWPRLRRDRVARFWAAVMLLALVPAATVGPLSKNLGFVAVGAFGVVGSFLAQFSVPQERAALPGPVWALSWFVAVWLVVAHVPGALAGRAGLAWVSPLLPQVTASACEFERSPEIGERDVVIVNDPTMASMLVPFERAYRGRPVPRSVRTLVPGTVRLQVSRRDASTLLVSARQADLFDTPVQRPLHVGHVCKAANDLLLGGRTWKVGERVACKGFVAEVLELSPRGLPRSMAFHFDRALESEKFVWLFFDWRHLTHSPFVPPQPGQTVEIGGLRQ